MTPIPDAALDDRLGFIGTSGSGKTYNAGGSVERLLNRRARVVIVDPLGVWWGLRLLADGKAPSPYNVVIFGGEHGDLPLNEHAGAVIGETAATMAESCIVDISDLGAKAPERRFMTAFLETIFRRAAGDPLHLIVDEADLFAPQKPQKGDEVLLGRMEQIVRRGRVKGFIPWLISQRPAVLNKNVLSQVDGLIAFKLTASQDRDALDAWIEGQADRAEGRAIKDSLPALQIGQGVVWIPGRSVLDTVSFPEKLTFDSSATPKRGQKKRSTATPQPLNVDALKGKLETVAKEVVENDPRRLKARIAELERQTRARGAPDPAALSEAEHRGYLRGVAAESERLLDAFSGLVKQIAPVVEKGNLLVAAGAELAAALQKIAPALAAAPPDVAQIEAPRAAAPSPAPRGRPAPVVQRSERAAHNGHAAGSNPAGRTNDSERAITNPQQKILDALAWWQSIGVMPTSRVQVAIVAGYSQSSGGFNNLLGSLRSADLIDYPTAGNVALTAAGSGLANAPGQPPSTEELQNRVYEVLSAPQRRVLSAIVEAYPDIIDRAALGERTGYSATSGGFNNLLGSLRSLKLIDYPAPGQVAAEPVLFIGSGA